MELYSRQKSVSVRMLNENLVVAETALVDPAHEIKVAIYYLIPEGVISDARAEFIRYPWDVCPQAAMVMSRIVGMSLGRGLRMKIEESVGKKDGCSHMADLVVEAIKGLVQAQFRIRYRDLDPEQRAEAARTDLKGTCLAFSNPERKPIPRGNWVSQKTADFK